MLSDLRWNVVNMIFFLSLFAFSFPQTFLPYSFFEQWIAYYLRTSSPFFNSQGVVKKTTATLSRKHIVPLSYGSQSPTFNHKRILRADYQTRFLCSALSPNSCLCIMSSMSGGEVWFTASASSTCLLQLNWFRFLRVTQWALAAPTFTSSDLLYELLHRNNYIYLFF